jgi:Flp pilus assembly protein TadB
METLLTKIKSWFAALLVWLKANMTIVYVVVFALAAVFLVPKLYMMFFKKRTYRRRRRILPRSVGLRRRSPGRGKGSEYMRRKMARLRSMRRRKR